MSTKNKLSYRDVVNLWKHYVVDRTGHESDDSAWSSRALITQFLILRSSLLRSVVKSGEDIGIQSVQTIPCIELDSVPLASCPCVAPSGCRWLKSIHPIPNFIKITSVTTIDGKETIGFTSWDKVKYKTQYSRVKSKDKLTYTIQVKNGLNYLYILGDDNLELVSLSGVFEDPSCISSFPSCGDKKKTKEQIIRECNPWDSPFLLDQGLLNEIFMMAWRVLPALRRQAGSDIFPDDLDNTSGDINPNI